MRAYSPSVEYASTQSSPTLSHQSTQANAATDSCPCTCALELSQLRQEVLDMKVQMKNQLKIIYNTLMSLSNAPSLEPATIPSSSPQQNSNPPSSASSLHSASKGVSYVNAAPPTSPATTKVNSPEATSTLQHVCPPLGDFQTTCPPSPVTETPTPVKEIPENPTPLKHPKVLTMWGTRRSTTEEEVSQAIRSIAFGLNDAQPRARYANMKLGGL